MEAKQHPVLFKDYARRVIEILASVRLWKKSGSKAVLELFYKHLCLSRHWGKNSSMKSTEKTS